MLFFTFIKGGGVTPLTGPPNLNGFLSIIRGGEGKILIDECQQENVFFNEGFPYPHLENTKEFMFHIFFTLLQKVPRGRGGQLMMVETRRWRRP